MATILPPIGFTKGTKETQSKKDPTTSSFERRGSFSLKNKIVIYKQGLEPAIRQQLLKEQLPQLTDEKIAEFHWSLKHTFCVELLEEGLHMSFSEMFDLVNKHKELRGEGPDSPMYYQTPLEEEPVKLNLLRGYLTKIETAYRQEKYLQAYKMRKELAMCFTSPSDNWIMLHIYDCCLELSDFCNTDREKVMCDCHINLGEIKMQTDLEKAVEHFEMALKIGKRKNWRFEGGQSLHRKCCKHLQKIYYDYSQEVVQLNPDLSVAYLQKAYELSKTGGALKNFAMACHKLGILYIQFGQYDEAVKYLKKNIEASTKINDHESLSKAYHHMGLIYQKQGLYTYAIKYFKMALESAETSDYLYILSKSCSSLAEVYLNLGQFGTAEEVSTRSYIVSQRIHFGDTLDSASIQFGIVQALQRLMYFEHAIAKPNMLSLILWKDQRIYGLE